MTDLNIVNGTATDELITHQNAPASAKPTPVVEVDPEQGTYLRLKNVPSPDGSVAGLPIYAKLRNSAGDHLPVTSSMYFEVIRAGEDDATKHSIKLESLEFYATNSINEQRDEDVARHAYLPLTAGDAANGEQVQAINVRDVDTAYFVLDSPEQIDWSQSKWFIASEAVDTHSRR